MIKSKIKSWTCEICDKSVSEIGAYVKHAMNKYAHLTCHNSQLHEHAREQGRREILDEQDKANQARMLRERKEREEIQAKERAEAERRLEIQERERTNRIQAAKNNPLPPKIEPKKEETNAKQEDRPDRFKLIDLE